jgi:hypothetical protein
MGGAATKVVVVFGSCGVDGEGVLLLLHPTTNPTTAARTITFVDRPVFMPDGAHSLAASGPN